MNVTEVEELTITQMQELMERGELSSFELTKNYLQRIAKYDQEGTKLNSILEVNPDALLIAESMDYERKYKGARGPLHGIPIVVKDNINTGDKMHTSAGSLILADNYAPDDAYLVKRLRKAGAVILGKSNMTEYANFMSDHMPSGYSSRGGQVLNPYDWTKTPSGSSSGSAVAAAANLCAAAVGTETDGSILSPSRANGIVGFKPTVGLISREGVIPISNSQDTAGPMARTVTDAAILLGAMTGVDEKDPATWKSQWFLHKDYRPFLDLNGLKGLRVGISMAYYSQFTDEGKNALDEAAAAIKALGVDTIDLDFIHTGSSEEESSVLIHEFKTGINHYLSTLKGNRSIRNLDDIIQLNRNNPDTCLKYGQKILELSQNTSGRLTESRYIMDRLKDIHNTRDNGIDKIMDTWNLDAILMLEGTSIAALSGYPSIIVPAGFSKDKTAYGITFIGKAFREPVLFSLAYAYEQAARKRIPPQLDAIPFQ